MDSAKTALPDGECEVTMHLPGADGAEEHAEDERLIKLLWGGLILAIAPWRLVSRLHLIRLSFHRNREFNQG
jgi:hypothetical protein